MTQLPVYYDLIVKTPLDVGSLTLYQLFEQEQCLDMLFADLVATVSRSRSEERSHLMAVVELYEKKLIQESVLDITFEEILFQYSLLVKMLRILLETPKYRPALKTTLAYKELGRLVSLGYKSAGSLILTLIPKETRLTPEQLEPKMQI